MYLIKRNAELNVLSPKNDYIFKRIFSKKGNESMLKDFLTGFLNEKIENIDVQQEAQLQSDVISRKILYARFKSNIRR